MFLGSFISYCLYHVNIYGSYGHVRFGAICHLTSCTVLKNIEITNKVYIEDSLIGYVLEPKEKLLERTFPRVLVAKEQCNLEDPAIIERVMVGEERMNKNRNAKKWGKKKRSKDE